MSGLPRISFGMIVLNGEPFTRYNLRSLYPWAHQIIVAEGAAPAASNIARSDGHSRDGTLEGLRRFKAEEDPDDKLVIVTAEDVGHPNGFWPGEKDEQSAAYAARATGDYLWQVDVDEFYRAEEMERMVGLLRDDPSISAVTFKQITFWGDLRHWVDGWYLRRGATYYHRLFKWGPGFTYATHRPPTVLDREGRELRTIHWLDGETTAAMGLRLYHYSLLLPKQVTEKCDYYANADWAKRSGANLWAQDAFHALKRPYRVHNVYDYPSWLETYRGKHPEQVKMMVADLRRGGEIALRDCSDVERLLASRRYRLGRWLLKRLDPIELRARGFARRLSQRLLARLSRKAIAPVN